MRGRVLAIVLAGVVVVVSTAFPIVLVFAVYASLSVVIDVPYGIYKQADLSRNFEDNRTALEAVITEAVATRVSSAKRGYWSLSGYKLPEPQGAEYKQLYRAMRQARVQQVHVLEKERFTVELVTDGRSALIDTNRYGYLYADDPSYYIVSYYPQLDSQWYLFEEIP
jgi:hypothetical protein